MSDPINIIRTEGHVTGWVSSLAGTALLYAQDHMLGIAGFVSVLYGMWVQRQTLKLKEREVAIREREAEKAHPKAELIVAPRV